MLRFANTITYSNEYNFCDCLRPRATRHEPFGPELTAEGLVDMSQTEGLTRLGLARRRQYLAPRASTELSRSLNKYVIEFMNRGTKPLLNQPFHHKKEKIKSVPYSHLFFPTFSPFNIHTPPSANFHMISCINDLTV